MPSVTRKFLGWEEPVVPLICRELMRGWESGPLDLSHLLIVVPTRNAGRRLREALAEQAALRGTVVFPAATVTPDFFLTVRRNEGARVANNCETLSVWVQVLQKLDLGDYPVLFPHAGAGVRRDIHWLLGTAERFSKLRRELAENGLTMTTAGEKLANGPDGERWADLARLEAAFCEAMRGTGLRDADAAKIEASLQPSLPPGIEHIMLVAVPDPVPLALTAFETLADRLAFTVYVHAPTSMQDRFDQWGRPLVDYWSEAPVELPETDTNLILEGMPMDQAAMVADLLHDDERGRDDFAIGVPDHEVSGYLAKELQKQGILTYDPAGESLGSHPVSTLLTYLLELIQRSDYAAFSAFVRHPDSLDYFARVLPDFSVTRLLCELDTFQNDYLPMHFEGMLRALNVARETADRQDTAYATLGQACDRTQKIVEWIDQKGPVEGVLEFLRAVYQDRDLSATSAEDELFTEAAKAVRDILRELSTREFQQLGMVPESVMSLLLRALKRCMAYRDRQVGSIDLQGWLELPWDDAPQLIITGMNEGRAPQTVIGDAFLPDGARTQLGLSNNHQRFARDVYLLRGMIESRRQTGSVVLIAGKTTTQGDPLKPSRLLFLCDDEELAHRTDRLFGVVEHAREVVPRTVPWLLKPPRCTPPDHISVTQFASFLACPFRFYLQHVVGMEQVDDTKAELDAMDFGSLCHRALETLAGPDLIGVTDPGAIETQLHRALDTVVETRYGKRLSTALIIQLDSARQRLSAAARIQADLNAEGWQILHTEYKLGRGQGVSLNGMRVTGKVDRIDRHPNGALRILDYKTSESARSPADALWTSVSEETVDYARVMIGGKERKWADLQLPLYHLLLCEEMGETAIECGYFNLPRAVSATGVDIWDNVTESVLRSARTCAEGVIADVLNGRFWPPASRLKYDDFEDLFVVPADALVDLETARELFSEH
ncbi:MAG: PD-(D/E)XK nuclease family protein [Candidatus Pacebacteria bacterium]|nr:PD-(D/E)XK nuclease family protein [Candidatus Paceibacterota bacterium]